jgi:hypothetical protein
MDGKEIKEKDHSDLAFARSFKPTKPKAMYGWVLDYARDRIDFRMKLTDVLDEKAGALMRYIGGVTIALSSALPFLFKERITLVLAFVPVLLALWAAIVKSSQCTVPQTIQAFPAIEKAFRYAEYFDDDAEARFYATAAPLSNQLTALIERKAICINMAFRYFCFALLWLIIAVIFSVFDFAGTFTKGPSSVPPILCLLVGLFLMFVAGRIPCRDSKKSETIETLES